jgi:hypothetical protein
MSGADYHEYEGGHFAEKIHDQFSGEVYENEHTATTDAAFRFETTEVKLRGGMILVSTYDALIGDSSNQRYPKTAGTAFSVGDVDLSQLYFKNAGAGNNTKINIVGVNI